MAECKSCGGFVTEDYVRVFGDNDGNVFDCRNCRARSDEADEEESGERVVLLREVTGTGTAAGTDRGGTRDTQGAAGDGASDRTTADGDGPDGPGGDDQGTVDGTRTQEAESAGAAATDRESDAGGGARERLAGLFSSLRG